MKPLTIIGSNDLVQALGVRSFRQRFPWIGPDLQTIKNTATAFRLKPVSGHMTRHQIPCKAGMLSAMLNIPLRGKAKAVVVLCPGLGGTEKSSYMREYAAALVPSGFATLRWNYRGSGPSAPTSTGPYNAGLCEDLRAVLNAIPKEVSHLPIFLLGFSLGGHLVLRTLGEGNLPKSVLGAVSISAPLDLSASMKTLERPRNNFYMQYLVKKLKRDLTPDLLEQAEGLTSMRDIDDKITGPAFGYKDAEDYYANRSAKSLISNIEVPILAIHSMDDPWIPFQSYATVTWPDHIRSAALLTPYGGHMGFHGTGDSRPWSLDIMLRYFNHLHVLRA